MSRPQTPLGLSPRNSYVNLREAADPHSHTAPNGLASPIRAALDEKERLKAEMEVHAKLLREDGAEKAKKEEPGLPAGSPGALYLSTSKLSSHNALRSSAAR